VASEEAAGLSTRAPGAAFALAVLFGATPHPSRAEDAVAYVLDATGAASGRIRVEIALPVPVPAPAALVVPRNYPGGYSFVLYDGAVENVKGFSPDGTALAVLRDAYGPRWALGKAGERVARVAYEVDVARMEREIHDAVAASKVRPRYAGFLGYSVFGYVDGEERRPASLEVRAPEGWPVLATLAPAVPAPAGRASARAPDYDTLADSQVLMGPALKVSRLAGTIPLVFAAYVEGESDLPLESALARTALDRVQAYFGDAPIRQYTVQLELLTPLAGHGYGFSQEHVDSGTFSLSLERATTARTGADARERTLVNYAHHMAHSWIPKRAYGAGYFPHTWEAPPVIDTIWFNEGFGRYAAVQALADGMPSAEGAAFRARTLARLRAILDEAPPFVRRMPLAGLSRSASFLYSADFRIGMSTFARGSLMAAEMDERIRAATGGTMSLRDGLRALLKAPQPFRTEDLPAIFRGATGVDVREVLDRWMKEPPACCRPPVRGRMRSPAAAAFSDAVRAAELDVVAREADLARRFP
jgi:predicted metalloprotease with PDZ domain